MFKQGRRGDALAGVEGTVEGAVEHGEQRVPYREAVSGIEGDQ
jgi:hypothetical protein